MLLPPSIERTMAGPAISKQALLVVSPSGRIQFATARAIQWLKDLAVSPPNRGPHPPAGWLADFVLSSQLSRLVVDRSGKELRFQIIHREQNSICLLLEQTAKKSATNKARGHLTQRQVEVLSWVARGKTNAQIASILRLKTGTIGKYLERIFPKLGVENRTAAASFVLGTNGAA
ncbi:MAG TPA: LuxR C-terminal-related transcriptional regulator [Chthoniobacterales bacterium]|nr:LuxR C-terminal-related transcriptional regulator [Chthoniobacterales bacterium]